MEIRPTGLLDPNLEVRPTSGQVANLLSEINKQIEIGERCLVTVLTIKFAEEVSGYLNDMGIKAHHLHSEIDTIQRTEIINALRLGLIDVIVGINLLREGLDIPEVSLVAIFDADKQGFLRNERSLLQTMGRASRNVNGRVILYADTISPAMQAAIQQTLERRLRQEKHNKENGIIPRTIVKALPEMNSKEDDFIAGTSTNMAGSKRLVAKKGGRKDGDWAQKLNIGAGSWQHSNNDSNATGEVNSSIEKSNSQLIYGEPGEIRNNLSPEQIHDLLAELKSAMRKAAKQLDFEQAAKLRDRVFEIEQML
jgi:excinuclease ABC subunit B